MVSKTPIAVIEGTTQPLDTLTRNIGALQGGQRAEGMALIEKQDQGIE